MLAKRKSVDAHQVFKAGANASTTKPNKRQKKDDLLDILEQSNKTVDSDSGSEVSIKSNQTASTALSLIINIRVSFVFSISVGR